MRVAVFAVVIWAGVVLAALAVAYLIRHGWPPVVLVRAASGWR